MTYLRSALACLAAAVVLGPFAAPVLAVGSAAGCSGVEVGLEWTTIAGPNFPNEPQRITAHAIAARKPGRIWVTNGVDIMLTSDGGCKWTEAFSLAELPDLQMPVSQLTSTIRAIEVPEAGSAQSEIYAFVEETIGPTKRPHVLASSDLGKSWALRDDGFPPVSGALIDMNISPSDPDRIYLVLQGTPVTNAQVWRSQNAGGSWQQTGEVLGVNGFRIDPQNRDELWFSGGAIQHSTDGGQSVRLITYVTNPAPFVDVFRAPGGESRIMAYEAESLAFTRSDDSGITWQLNTAPPNVLLSVAHGNDADAIIASMHEGVYRFQAPFYWIEVTPGLQQGVKLDPDYEDIIDLQVERTDKPAAIGRRPNSLMRYTGFSIDLPSLEPQPPLSKTGAALIGPKDKVKIPAGKSRRVKYRLRLPPQPTPLDVFFLMDTTLSMDSSINGLLFGIQRIAAALNSAKVDVRFGIGEYKDYPIPGYGDPTAGDFPYRRNRDLGLADASLVAALEKMQASGGGTSHAPESQLTALYQAATGEGEPGCAPETGPGGADNGPTASRACVPPGQGATFRGDALRVMVNITDAPFDQSPAHPSPPFNIVADELKARGILQIGLAVYGPNGIKAARADLQRMAADTGAIVPAGGVDCDGDGFKELVAGAPLVCDITDNERAGVKNLSSAILSSLRAVTDIAPVGLVATSGETLIDKISPAYPGVDVKAPQELTFTVTYKCPAAGKPRASVQLIGLVREASVADTATRVVCLPPKKTPEPTLPPALAEIPLVAAVALPPPPPPAPVSQTQPQPNPNLQGAMAAQEQEQAQVAPVTEGYQEDLEEDYAMSSYSGRSRSLGAGAIPLYGAALALSFAAAAVRLRHRHALARNRST